MPSSLIAHRGSLLPQPDTMFACPPTSSRERQSRSSLTVRQTISGGLAALFSSNDHQLTCRSPLKTSTSAPATLNPEAGATCCYLQTHGTCSTCYRTLAVDIALCHASCDSAPSQPPNPGNSPTSGVMRPWVAPATMRSAHKPHKLPYLERRCCTKSLGEKHRGRH